VCGIREEVNMEKNFSIHAIARRHFQTTGSGTLVTDSDQFWSALQAAELPDPSVGGVEGQCSVALPTTCVSGAYTLLTQVDPADVRAVGHRGRMETYVPREKYPACPVSSAKAVVYTRQAIKEDPDWDGVEPEGDYVLVTVVANVSPSGDPLSPISFCHNLGGGNIRYASANGYTFEKAVAEAKRVEEFSLTYIKVG